MSSGGPVAEQDWDRVRRYLRVLVEAGVEDRLRSKLDPSDIVQQTLMQAVAAGDSFRGTTDGERLAWLREILANNLAMAVRHHTRKKRDVGRERAILAALEASAIRGESLLVSKEDAPDAHALRSERVLALYDALGTLPDDQRTAVELHYWQGMKVSEVAARMERTVTSVGGLLKRGLKGLRSSLAGES